MANLAVALADVAHKWNEIAIMLGLPEVLRTECGEGSNSAMKLYNVLHKWIVGGHSTAAPSTMKTLKKAIESPLVERPDIANKLEDKFMIVISTPASTSFEESVLIKYKKNLCLRYSRFEEVPRGAWPPVVNNTFINLALINTSGESSSDYSVRGDADDVLAKKEKIEYKQAFGTYNSSEILLMLGRPGSGKTTLVHKVVKDWAQSLVLKGAELVYLISLRSLTSEHNKLPNILSPFHFQENTLQEVSVNIEEVDGKGVCFILDGFDEYPSQNYEKSIINALINKSYLPEAMVVVTSRPAAASAYLPNKSSFKLIEVFGFSNKDIFEYVDNFPFPKSTEPLSEKLKNFLKSHPGVLDLCYLPVNVAIICFLYNDAPKLLPKTQTEMYKLFTASIIIRQLKQYDKFFKLDSLEDLRGKDAECFKNLCRVAFVMMVKVRQVMSHGELNIDNKNCLGLVTIDVSARWSGEIQNSYSFLHLTLQEFLAAYHISKTSQEMQKDVIVQYHGKVHMRNVWKFYFGLVNFEDELLRHVHGFFKACNDQLLSVQCAYEAKQKSIVELVTSLRIDHHGAVSTYDISAIAYVMSEAASIHNRATPTTDVTLTGIIMNDNKFASLMHQLSAKAKNYLAHVDISYNLLSSTSIKLLVDELNANFTSLQKLYLVNNDIGDDGVVTLTEYFRHHNSLQELNLSGNQITTAGVSTLIRYTCFLKCLHLCHNDIGDDGAEKVADELKHYCSLQKLSLSNCNIGVDGAEALANAIPDKMVNWIYLIVTLENQSMN